MGRNGMGKTTTIRSIMGLTPARAGSDPVRRTGGSQASLVPDRAAGHRPGPRRASDISESDGARKSRRRLRQPARQPRSLDHRKDPRAVSAAVRARRQHGRHAVRRRAADAGDRPRADDQSATVDPRRGHRRPCAADPRRNLELPVDAESTRPVGAGDRQERRKPHPHRRPPLHHRARPCGVERHVGAADRGARSAASISRGFEGRALRRHCEAREATKQSDFRICGTHGIASLRSQ